MLFDAVVRRERTRYNNQLIAVLFSAGPLVVIAMLVGATAPSLQTLSGLLLFIAAFGIFPLAECAWAWRKLRQYTPEAMQRDVPEVRYRAWISRQTATWTWVIVACSFLVGVAQWLAGMEQSIAAAGLDKAAVQSGETWRLFTGALLHANLPYFAYNVMVLYSLGHQVEALTRRAYVNIVFVLAALAGSLLSLLWLPGQASAGASGGLVGLMGFLIVFGYRRRRALPLEFFRMLLLIAISVVALSVAAHGVIDNAGELGSLLMGAIIGALVIPADDARMPMPASRVTEFAGIVAISAIGAATLLCLHAIFPRAF